MRTRFWALIALLLLGGIYGGPVRGEARAPEPVVAEPTEDNPLVEEEEVQAIQEVKFDAPEGKPVLTFWCSPYPLESGWAVRITRRWNQLHPDKAIQLRTLPPDRLAEDVFREAIRKGSTPDITNHLFPANVHEFAEMGGLTPLERFPDLMEHLKNRSGSKQVENFRSPDGHLYQFPWKNNPILFQYNSELFRRYGVLPPRTYSEFLEAGRQLEAMSGQKIWLWAPSPTAKFWKRYYDFLTLYLAASGGQNLLTREGRANFNNADGVAVMKFLADLFRNGAAPRQELFPDDPDQVQAFVGHRLGMMLTGPWNIELVRDVGGEGVLFDFTAIPVPDVYPESRPVYTYGNYRNFGIFTTSKKPELAAEFIQFATSRESDLDFLREAVQLPCRADLQQDPEFVTALNLGPSYLAKFALQGQWVRPLDNAPHLNQVLEILSEELVACAVEGRKPPEQAIRDAAARTDALAEKYRQFYTQGAAATP